MGSIDVLAKTSNQSLDAPAGGRRIDPPGAIAGRFERWSIPILMGSGGNSKNKDENRKKFPWNALIFKMFNGPKSLITSSCVYLWLAEQDR
jgi:hypothetical protein